MRVLLAIFAVVVILLAIILLIFSGPSDKPADTGRKIDLAQLVDTGATTVYTVEGEINAEEEHRAIRISVNRNLRTVEVLNGYSDIVAKSQNFPNTQAAYDEFMHALKNAGYTRQKTTPATSEKGVCPLGRRYIYEVEDLSQDLQRLWSTSCSQKEGTFAGSADLIRQLFQNQIPEYDEFVTDVDL